MRGDAIFGERRAGLEVYGHRMKLPFSRFLAPLSLAVGLLFGAGLAEGAEPRTVIAYGDSITQGGALSAEEKNRLWVTLVEAQSGGKLKLINEGKGGRPTKSLPEFEAMLTRQTKADALIIALGANDARLDIKETCVPNAVANVTKMIELARKPTARSCPSCWWGRRTSGRMRWGRPSRSRRSGRRR
ncbi:SGNH/GDSL hydrolase family protein [Verrucomicrobium spinosum]|uniref:SGNH/GDSL hydrolase family protein n=1 Tax=Verrucomicrobium spinosum TaxID=2736 RepID=UPI001C45456B|nr:SGNH/GDSL hydrolase family protein [Verrucomicrobium spinosum]